MSSPGLQRAGALALPFLVGLVALALSPSLLRFEPRRMTNDEAHYAWKAQRLSEDLGRVADAKSWRRHPPAVPLATALLAQPLSFDAALAASPKLALWLATSAMAAAGAALGGPLAGVLAGGLLVLGGTVRAFAPHYLLDLPLLACLLGAVALWARGGAARRVAFALALLAVFVKSYGAVVLVVLVAAELYARAPTRLRVAFWAAGVAGLAGLHGLRELGVDFPVFWLRPIDLVATTQTKLYGIAEGFAWMLPGARGRSVIVLLAALLAFAAWSLRAIPRRHRALLAMLLAVPGGPLAITNVTDSRMLLLLIVPLELVLAVGVARAVGALAPVPRRAAAVGLGALLAGVLVYQDRVAAAPLDPCRYVGQWELAQRLLQEPGARSTRVYAAGIFQTRLYAGLELEIDGGTIYGPDERHWISSPREFFEGDEALHEAYLALVWNRDNNFWLQFEPAVAARLRRAGFRGVDAVYLPANPACAPADDAQRAAEDAFFAAFGLSRTRTTPEGVREQAMGLLLHRPRPTTPPPEYTGYVHPNRPW